MIEWLVIGGGALWALLAKRQAQELDAVDTVYGLNITMNYNPGVITTAKAIAKQEGFYVQGSVPARNHNPGDLTGDRGWGVDVENIATFPDDSTGWDALYRQLQLIADGQSHVYTLSMTLQQMAEHYAPQPDPATWANNVAGFLGVTPDTTLDQILT